MNHVLFTNLAYIKINGVRAFANAFLLQEDEDILDRKKKRYQARAFGTGPAWPVIDVSLPSMKYTIKTAALPHVFVGIDDKPRPLISGAILQIENGPEFQLVVSDHDRPIDVKKIWGDITDVWTVLPGLVARYWMAPNMPVLGWQSAEQVRRALKVG